MFIEPAYAQSGGSGTDFVSLLLPFALIAVVMYFLIIRPQQKRMRSHKDMVGALRRGDVVSTSGGLIAKIHRIVDDREVILEIADNVRIVHLKQMISEVRSRTEPLDSDGQEAKKEPKEKPKKKKRIQNKKEQS